jgi:hypothetical protein
MDKHTVAVMMGICFFGFVLLANEQILNDHYFAVKCSELDTEGRIATSAAKKKSTAKAFYSLAMQAINTNAIGLSTATRLSVMVSSTEAVDRYVRAILNNPKELEEFAASPEMLDSLFLLETSADMLSRIRDTHLKANIAPPRITTGPTAAGMDPAAIKDPEARAEYERRRAANVDVVRVTTSWSRLKQTTASLQNALRDMMLNLAAEGKAEPLRTVVSSSKIPTEIKFYILADEAIGGTGSSGIAN